MHRFSNGEARLGPAMPTRNPQVNPDQSLYAGWMDVDRPKIQAMDRYVTESMQAFPGGWVETRQFSWSHPMECVWLTTRRCYMLNLALAGWVSGGRCGMRVGPPQEIGRMWLIPPGQRMQVFSTGGQMRSIRCALDAEMIEQYLDDAPDWKDAAALQAAFNIGGSQIEALLRRMDRELRNPDTATAFVTEMLARQLAAEIVRALKLRRPQPGFCVGGLAPWRLSLIRQRVLAETATMPRLEELAGLCGMTVRHLGRAFRGETGQTIGKYVEAAMVNRANRLLRAEMPVRAVAEALGYASPRSFATAFHRATGLLPSEITGAGKPRGKGRRQAVN